jgi:hypothetical protein
MRSRLTVMPGASFSSTLGSTLQLHKGRGHCLQKSFRHMASVDLRQGRLDSTAGEFQRPSS